MDNKKLEGPLRPLTEKDIQQKLYGASKASERLAHEWEEDFLKIPKKPSLRLPKPSFGVLWDQLTSVLEAGAKGLVAPLREVSTHFRKGWGVSILAVVGLFLAINALNAYRIKAMKKAPQPATQTQVKEVKPSPPPSGQESALKKPDRAVPSEPIQPVRNIPQDFPAKAYSIQVCTYAKEEDAEDLLTKMNTEGLPGFVRPLERSHGKTFYLVFLGRFGSFREAQAELEKFKKLPLSKDFSDSFVRAV